MFFPSILPMLLVDDEVSRAAAAGSGGSSGGGFEPPNEGMEFIVVGPTPKIVTGFGVSIYKEGTGGAVGDLTPTYSTCDVVCKANSVDGTFEFAQALDKFVALEVDIINAAFKNTGLPHWVVEDTLEWGNSGMPSHLSQVYHANIANMGIALDRSDHGLVDENAPLYQARFLSVRNKNWYDWFNSTVDFELASSLGDTGFSLPYANAVLYVENIQRVLVGGQGTLMTIDPSTLAVSRIVVDARRTLFIKDLFYFDGKVYILDENSLYIWDLGSGIIARDNGLGLPNRLNKVIVMFSQNLVIGGDDGLYARKITQDSWQKVAATGSAVDGLIAPDSAFATANGEFWYSSEGFSWKKIGIVSDKTINQIVKHRSQILVGSSAGAYGDNGSLYSNQIALYLQDILNNPSSSASVIVNAVASNDELSVFGLSDGRYVTYDGSYDLHEDSLLPTIHKIALVEGIVWLFAYDTFRVTSEDKVRRLSSGSPIG